jgi:hypothetical protein
MSDHHATDSWERWVGSTTPPIQRIKRRARVDTRGGRPWITHRDEINGTSVIVEMPNNAPPGPATRAATTTARTASAAPKKAV